MCTATDSRTRLKIAWRPIVQPAALTAALLLCACTHNWNPETELRQAGRLYEASDYDGALRIADAGISAAGKDSASEWYWRFRLLKSEILSAQSSPKAALQLLERPVGPVPHASEMEAQRLTDLGSISLNTLDYEQASGYFDRALTLAAAFPDSQVFGKLDLCRGLVLMRGRGDLAGAEALFRHALQKATERGDLYIAGS